MAGSRDAIVVLLCEMSTACSAAAGLKVCLTVPRNGCESVQRPQRDKREHGMLECVLGRPIYGSLFLSHGPNSAPLWVATSGSCQSRG